MRRIKTVTYVGPETDVWFDDKVNLLLEEGYELLSTAVSAGQSRSRTMVPILMAVLLEPEVQTTLEKAEKPQKRGRGRPPKKKTPPTGFAPELEDELGI